MESYGNELSGTSPGTGANVTTRETVVCTKEAAETSPNSSEAPAPRLIKRRMKAEVSSPSPNDSHTGTGSQRRVLRDRAARGAVPCERAERCSRSKNDSRQRRPESPRRRGRLTGLRSKDTDATDTASKKPTAKKASPRTPQPKLSKSGKGQHRTLTRAPRSIPEKVCKTEPETEVALCGVEGDTLKRNDENTDGDVSSGDQTPPLTDDPSDPNYKPEARREKPRRRPSNQKEEKKGKETERESEENVIKMEGSTEIIVKMEDEIGEDVEQPRKRGRPRKDGKTPQPPKRRKKPPVQYVRCEMEGCGTVLAHPRYLQHHIKYQHLLKKKYVCNHPSCGRLFRLQKQLLRHAKHHTDQRDYICEYCARAFKSSHNLAVHRMIHTGEKPIQCEICGFTCRQKASLNWHMKKHDADAFYQFSCSICGKKFEKKDCVVAHKAKSHPEVLIAEALAANAGTLLTAPAPVLETLPVVSSPNVHPASQENQGALGGSLTPLQQVVLPITPQTPKDASQAQPLQLTPHHMVQLRQQQETPTLLHLTTSTAHPQLIQLTALPVATTTASVAVTDPQATLLTLSSIATLSPAATLAPNQAVEWVREANGEAQPSGDGMLWDRVVVTGEQDVGEIVWEGDRERVRDDAGIVWEREGERQILLDSAEVHGDGLI